MHISPRKHIWIDAFAAFKRAEINHINWLLWHVILRAIINARNGLPWDDKPLFVMGCDAGVMMM